MTAAGPSPRRRAAARRRPRSLATATPSPQRRRSSRKAVISRWAAVQAVIDPWALAAATSRWGLAQRVEGRGHRDIQELLDVGTLVVRGDDLVRGRERGKEFIGVPMRHGR